MSAQREVIAGPDVPKAIDPAGPDYDAGAAAARPAHLDWMCRAGRLAVGMKNQPRN
jgi:hypothetical protein